MHSLRAKFLVAFILVALVGVGAVALVANRVTQREFTLYVSQGGKMRAQRLAVELADYYAQTGSWDGVEALLGQSSSVRGGPGYGRGPSMHPMITEAERALIVGIDGRIVVDSQGALVGQKLGSAELVNGAPIVVGGQTVGTLLISSEDLSGQTALDQQFLGAVQRAVFLAGLSASIVAIIAAVWLSRHLIAPLRQLTAASEAMAQGDLSQRVQVHSGDEVGELGVAFNKMAGDLQAAELQRQQMTADIAHELRNPLSVIRGNLEAMLDGIYPVDAEHLGPVYEETLLLQRLVQDLRLLSLADAGQLELVRTEVDLGQLLARAAEGAQAAAGDKGIALSVDAPPAPVLVQGDADRLRQVIGNLVGNALRHTPAGGRIMLSARPAGEQVLVAVSDTGAGIAPEDLPHIFDRFYRADASRMRTGGSGLGLSIARALVEAHGGRIEVKSKLGQGTVFTIALPKSQY